VITREFALHFARQWVEAWNRRDLDAVRAYWTAALEKLPGLRFELADTLAGAQSVILYYRGVRGMAAQIFQFDAHGKVVSAAAHYA
jgi:hypothetical protein